MVRGASGILARAFWRTPRHVEPSAQGIGAPAVERVIDGLVVHRFRVSGSWAGIRVGKSTLLVGRSQKRNPGSSSRSGSFDRLRTWVGRSVIGGGGLPQGSPGSRISGGSAGPSWRSALALIIKASPTPVTSPTVMT